MSELRNARSGRRRRSRRKAPSGLRGRSGRPGAKSPSVRGYAPGRAAARSVNAAWGVAASRFRRKLPIFRFVGLFAFFMSLAYVCEITPSIRKHVFPAYLRHNARVSGAILNVLGEDVRVHRRSISSPRFAIEVQHGCDALLPTGLFVAITLASPVRFRTKIPGIIVGTVILMLMNLVRIMSLYYAGIHLPESFRMIHTQVWPPVFVCLSLFLWIVWALWARDRAGRIANETG